MHASMAAGGACRKPDCLFGDPWGFSGMLALTAMALKRVGRGGFVAERPEA